MNVVLLHIENYPKNLIFKNNPYNTVIYVTNNLPNLIQNIRNIQILIKNYKVYFSGLLFPRNPNLEGVTQTATFALTLLARFLMNQKCSRAFRYNCHSKHGPGSVFLAGATVLCPTILSLSILGYSSKRSFVISIKALY